MRLDRDEIRWRAAERGLSVAALLRTAGVSRTAYYNLLRKDSILPRSVRSLADALGAPAAALLSEGTDVARAARVPHDRRADGSKQRGGAEQRARRRLARANRIVAANPGVTFENVWHTLVLLEAAPLERLNAALRRRGRPGTLRPA